MDSTTEAFLAQNPRMAADLTDDDRATADGYSDHHAGGLIVLEREVEDGVYVKAHDSWAGDDKVAVHVYEADSDDGGDYVELFDSGHDALARFLTIDADVLPGRQA